MRVSKNGTTELALLSGYSGIGKSSIVNALHKAIVPPRGLFASGKCDGVSERHACLLLVQPSGTQTRLKLPRTGPNHRQDCDQAAEGLGNQTRPKWEGVAIRARKAHR